MLKNSIFVASALIALTFATSCNSKPHYLKRIDWCDNVKNNLNEFIKRNRSDDKDNNNYVVFDFDNTCSIFDIEEQCITYQLDHMAFGIEPDKLKGILETGIKLSADISPYPGTYSDWIKDITTSYSNLYKNYGPFTPKGLDESKLSAIKEEDDYKDFTVKIAKMYDVIDHAEGHIVSYIWITYMFYGMTSEELYDLSYASCNHYKNVKSSRGTKKAPTPIKGVDVELEYTLGVNVSDNIVELMKELSSNNIKVWVCSASNIDVIRAAVDSFGLHDYVTGVIAMTNKMDDNGRMLNEYDYNGTGAIAKPNGKWEKDTYVVGTQTQGKGKVTAVNNALVARYKKGPLAGFMDSTGDFNFCTEYDSLQLVTCFNRADRSISDGGGLIAAIAMYQQNTLQYDLAKAIENKDTLYLLQGRDENDLRSLRNSNKTKKLGAKEDKLFKNEDNEKLLNYLIEKKEPIKTSIDRFAIKTSKDDPNNPLKVDYGFLDKYDGYHSI